MATKKKVAAKVAPEAAAPSGEPRIYRDLRVTELRCREVSLKPISGGRGLIVATNSDGSTIVRHADNPHMALFLSAETAELLAREILFRSDENVTAFSLAAK